MASWGMFIGVIVMVIGVFIIGSGIVLSVTNENNVTDARHTVDQNEKDYGANTAIYNRSVDHLEDMKMNRVWVGILIGAGALVMVAGLVVVVLMLVQNIRANNKLDQAWGGERGTVGGSGGNTQTTEDTSGYSFTRGDKGFDDF